MSNEVVPKFGKYAYLNNFHLFKYLFNYEVLLNINILTHLMLEMCYTAIAMFLYLAMC